MARIFPSIICQPGGWPTPDGWIPFRALPAWYAMIPAATALDRISLSRAVRMGFGGEGVGEMVRDDQARSTPE